MFALPWAVPLDFVALVGRRAEYVRLWMGIPPDQRAQPFQADVSIQNQPLTCSSSERFCRKFGPPKKHKVVQHGGH